jgi:hypothetical protein
MYVVPREIRGCRHGLPAKGGYEMGSSGNGGRTTSSRTTTAVAGGGGDGRAQSPRGSAGAGRADVGAPQWQVPVPRDKMMVTELVKKWKENYLTVQQQLGARRPPFAPTRATRQPYRTVLRGEAATEVTLAASGIHQGVARQGLSPKTIGNVIVILKRCSSMRSSGASGRHPVQ